jgi:hypothetical protein
LTAFLEHKAFKGCQCVVHPSYSVDLAPSEPLFLFKLLRSNLSQLIRTESSFRQKFKKALDAIPPKDFERAFDDWKDKCRKCIENREDIAFEAIFFSE